MNDLVAQTYDGVSNMSGKYKGLQALIKEHAGEQVIFTHCYARSLNLVLSDSACASLSVAKLFNKLQQVYVLFSKSQPIHDMFERVQEDMNEKVRSVKRIDAMQWSSREFALQLFLTLYDGIMTTLDLIMSDTNFDSDKRSKADGLFASFSEKDFLCTAYLWREIFAVTGPISRMLQGVDIDFGKALSLVDAALEQLSKLRSNPHLVLDSLEKDFPDNQRVPIRQARHFPDGSESSEQKMATRSILYANRLCYPRSPRKISRDFFSL